MYDVDFAVILGDYIINVDNILHLSVFLQQDRGGGGGGGD